MNVNPADAGAEMLIISQFTLFADCRSRRPGFSKAARPEKAVPLYELVISECRARGFTVGTGEFGAYMENRANPITRMSIFFVRTDVPP